MCLLCIFAVIWIRFACWSRFPSYFGYYYHFRFHRAGCCCRCASIVRFIHMSNVSLCVHSRSLCPILSSSRWKRASMFFRSCKNMNCLSRMRWEFCNICNNKSCMRWSTHRDPVKLRHEDILLSNRLRSICYELVYTYAAQCVVCIFLSSMWETIVKQADVAFTLALSTITKVQVFRTLSQIPQYVDVPMT